MKHLKNFGLVIIALSTLAASCKKNPSEPDPDSFYFQCKINGQLYIPNNCANCMSGTLLGDTTLLINGNAGYEAILIGIIKLDQIPISQISYILDNNLQQKAIYKNSTLTTNRYETDFMHRGQLHIASLDRSRKIISGTFYFQAYNANLNDSVTVTEGKFRLKYTIN